MSVPKKKRTKSSVGKRRSHHALKKLTLTICPQCGHKVLPHQVCSFCGTYRGKEVLAVPIKETKKKKES
jgi:large subunit ribosomal protein L32